MLILPQTFYALIETYYKNIETTFAIDRFTILVSKIIKL